MLNFKNQVRQNSLLLITKKTQAYSTPRPVSHWLPNWHSGKESVCGVGNPRDTGSVPRSGRVPGERNGNPFQYSCLGNHTDRGAWQATVHGVAESQK